MLLPRRPIITVLMPFPLYRRPGGVVFLDYDEDYLEMLATVMPTHWHVRLFQRPAVCVDMLLQEVSIWDDDTWCQQEILNRWTRGEALIPNILKYWLNDGVARYALTQVAVFDYAMPEMSGLRAMGELSNWQGSRILLTGHADEQLGVSAFNRGLIHQFIRKQSPTHRRDLALAVQNFLFQPHVRHQHIWQSTLTRSQLELLARSDLSIALSDLARKLGWIEHIAIGVPFGILGLDHHGKSTWMKLVPSSDLRNLAAIAQYDGLDLSTVREIVVGRILIERDLHASLGLGFVPERAQPAAIGLGPDSVYVGLFDIPDAFSPGTASSYARFLALQGDRVLQGQN